MTNEVEWQPITRDKPEVHGVNAQYPGLLDVSIRLSSYPDDAWSQFFLSPSGVGLPLSMHPPKLSGKAIFIRPPDNEVEAYVRHVDERLDAANRYYENTVLPRLRAQREAERRASDEKQERLDAARRRIEEL
jgi:hypothetical protein